MTAGVWRSGEMIGKYMARRHRYVWLLLSFACVFIITSISLFMEPSFLSHIFKTYDTDYSGHSAPIACYDDTTSNNLEDICDVPPIAGNSIFFHETSCASASGNGDLAFTNRQACAVESAARANPDADVYVLFLSPVRLKNILETRNVAIQALLSYSNIYFKHVTFSRYVEGTPLESWYKTGALKNSQWPTSHASDVMRYLTLWKYSGTYLDLDMVVLKSLSALKNFAGAESPRNLGAGVINLDSSDVGRSFATAFIHELSSSFSGSDWGANGPGVITRVLQRICQVKKVQDMSPEHCRGFTVHPPLAFYPISFEAWEAYFREDDSKETLKTHIDSYTAHLSNKFSARRNVTIGSKQPYGLLAAEHCPRVYASCSTVF